MELIEVNNVDESDPIWSLVASQAQKSTMYFQLGALIVDKKGRVLGKGYNTSKTHPLGSKKDFKTMHAEISALYDCIKHKKDVKGSTVIVYRRGGRMSKPCSCCESTLKKFGVKKVIYSNK